MPKSAAFVRIKADVLGIVRDVPRGRVCTYSAIGRHLNVMARHVAFILATLTDDERAGMPWHRVVAESGAINKSKHGRGTEQRAALEAEGVGVTPSGLVVDLPAIAWSPELRRGEPGAAANPARREQPFTDQRAPRRAGSAELGRQPTDTSAMQQIKWSDFVKVELRVGRVIAAAAFSEAHKPAHRIQVDFGPEIGVQKSSPQITALYQPKAMLGKLVVVKVDFPPEQGGPIMSESLVTGFSNANGDVTVCILEHDVPPGCSSL